MEVYDSSFEKSSSHTPFSPSTPQHDWTATLVRAGVCSGPFQLEQTSQDGFCLAHAIDGTLSRAEARLHLRDSLLADCGPGVDHAVNVVHAVFNMRAQPATM